MSRAVRGYTGCLFAMLGIPLGLLLAQFESGDSKSAAEVLNPVVLSVVGLIVGLALDKEKRDRDNTDK